MQNRPNPESPNPPDDDDTSQSRRGSEDLGSASSEDRPSWWSSSEGLPETSPPPPVEPRVPPSAVEEAPPGRTLPETPFPPSTPYEPVLAPPPARGGGGGRCLLFAVLGLLACGLISAVLAVGAAVTGFRVAQSLEIPIEGATVRESETRNFDVGNAPRLIVRNSNGRTEVRAGDSRRIEVEAVKRATGANAQDRLRSIQLDMNQTGDTVELSYRVPPTFGFGMGGAAVDFIVRVPSGTTVDVNANNGEVLIEGTREAVNVESDDGAVTLRDINGPVIAETNNGRITTNGTRGRLELRSDNGSIDVQEAQADNLRLQSSNGSVSFSGALGEGLHEARSSNGRIIFSLPRDQRLRVDVQTSNGSITNNLSLADARTERNRLSGTLNGGGPTLTIRSNNGSVTLQQR